MTSGCVESMHGELEHDSFSETQQIQWMVVEDAEELAIVQYSLLCLTVSMWMPLHWSKTLGVEQVYSIGFGKLERFSIGTWRQRLHCLHFFPGRRIHARL